MVTLSSLLSAEPVLSNWIGKLIYLMYGAIGSFGWTVVVFTICLKALVSPLDLWQKRVTRKNNKAMKRMQPELDRLRESFGDNPQVMQRKQMELYKAHGYSMMGACLPSLITMIIFFVVFSGFNAAVRYENQKIVYDLTNSYQELIIDTGLIDGDIESLYTHEEAVNTIKSYGIDLSKYNADGTYTTEEIDALIDNIMLKAYDDHGITDKGVQRWRWLWVDNVFVGDSWADTVPTLETYVGTGLGKLNSSLENTNLRIRAKYNNNVYNALLGPAMNEYNKTKTFDIKNWNGYLILPILSIALSIISTLLMRGSQPEQPKQYDANGKAIDTQKSMKIMTWMMPVMIGVFSLFYSAAFTIYMFFNSLITVTINLIYNAVTKKKDALEEARYSNKR